MPDLVQQLLVTNTGTPQNVCEAVASASCKAYLEAKEEPCWEDWFAGSFTKTVRRGTTGALTRAVASLGPCVSYKQHKDVCVWASWPLAKDEIPKEVSKLQVANFVRPEAGQVLHGGIPGPHVVYDLSLGMTTGKAAAQCAHAAMVWMLAQDEQVLDEWLLDDCPVTVFGVSKEAFAWELRFEMFAVNEKTGRPMVIVDKGLTELDGPTTTALVFRGY